MKDNFSKQASEYAKFRPDYPKDFISDILQLVKHKHTAWDCATGNGQVAVKLAEHFEKVIATDISDTQLSHAPKLENVEYRKEPAESTSLSDNSTDLITVAQAIHWFDFYKFFSEVNRVLKKDGVIALFGYSLFTTSSQIDKVVQHFYVEVTGPYWDPERRHIDKEYRTIPFHFEINPFKKYSIETEWNMDEMIGYFKTWSAVQHYINANNSDPTEELIPKLKKVWPTSKKVSVSMKLIHKIGRKIN